MSANCPKTTRDEPAQTTVIDYRAHSRSKSMEAGGRNVFAGRPLVPAPSTVGSLPLILDEEETQKDIPPTSYPDSTRRKTERQEAHSLRRAMESVHLDEEQKIHAAAQDEAADLVYKHRTGQDSPSQAQAYRNPDISQDQPIKDYRAHLRTRSALPWNSTPTDTISARPSPVAIDMRPSTSPSSPFRRAGASPSTNTGLSEEEDPFIDVTPPRSSKGKSYEKLAGAVASDVAQSRRRASSGANKRKPSEGQKGAFPSPEDKIFEEPDEDLKEAREAEAVKAAEKAHAEKLQAEKAEAEKAEAEKARLERERAEGRQETPEGSIPRHVRRNPFARVRQAQEKFEKKESPSGYSVKRFDKDDDGPRSSISPSPSPSRRFDRIEIHRNPPSQSRRAGYLSNETLPPTPPLPIEDVSEVEASPLMKDGKEIRGDDIRAATSMRRKDRSTNLPQPTAVSDSPGRPIVSFQQDWNTIELKEERVDSFQESLPLGQRAASPEFPSAKALPYSPSRAHQSPFSRPRVQQTASAPVPIPSISIPDASPRSSKVPAIYTPVAELPGGIPSIVVPDDPESPSKTLREEPDIPSIMLQNDTSRSSVPVINEPSDSEEPPRPKATPSPRPLPVPRAGPSAAKPYSGRPLPTTTQTSPLPRTSQSHYTPSVRRTTALCAHCALPISGRILSAAGERFHPACFKCHECSINLECVAFYPEPDQKRLERLARIDHRQQGLDTHVPEGFSEEDMLRLEEMDGDEGLRFFCHLDFHEMFSPRCKSCKTPIEGEVVVACGAEWHVGHFFCAQCGDVSA